MAWRETPSQFVWIDVRRSTGLSAQTSLNPKRVAGMDFLVFDCCQCPAIPLTGRPERGNLRSEFLRPRCRHRDPYLRVGQKPNCRNVVPSELGAGAWLARPLGHSPKALCRAFRCSSSSSRSCCCSCLVTFSAASRNRFALSAADIGSGFDEPKLNR
jgi:hypothetical protein